MENPDIKKLVRKYTNSSLTAEEQELLLGYMETHEEAVKEAIAGELAEHETLPAFRHRNYDHLIRKVMSVDDGKMVAGEAPVVPVRRVRVFNRTWLRYAAAVLIILGGIGIYRWNAVRDQLPHHDAPVATVNKVEPGKNGAVLTLADGTKVVLDSLADGIVSSQNGARVVLQDGRLTYQPTAASSEAIVYNTMSTPKGRQFSMVLPDGTRVWLNAASSLRYPTLFTGGERRVDITGEAYFEVAPLTPTGRKKLPFIVGLPGGATVEVLGTHFNINAYSDEPAITTTLLEGSVRVETGSQKPEVGSQTSDFRPQTSVFLKPGQQASMPFISSKSNESSPIEVQTADIAKVMAWKNGLFNFEDASLEQVMRQLTRWYDIEVVYEKGIPDTYFIGEIGKNTPLNDVLTFLEKTGVHFRLEGRRLVVQP
ncbi:DUF4974 domain-containing protein [Pseudoflavitalea sp. X16]|uniref:FecR family protein n=1 Tax=Paraflavitalea devenefica TaxID=2716334 RepID=UPI001421E972|nr:FecR family protein [Paraflavitalea devenefica]NII29342.1 DUF4974 domain-containing protein [Paraflavitalea devenefica]